MQHISSPEVVQNLNQLLANYQVHYQKLRNFHWNVKGGDFFDIHEQLELEYEQVKLNIDEIAERIRTCGATPFSTLQDYLNHSEIKEASAETPSDWMIAEILKDFEIIIQSLKSTIKVANEASDLGTLDLLTTDLKRIEKRHWMLQAFNS